MNLMKHYRKSAGLSQEKLARKLDISNSLISLIEQGRVKAYPKIRQRITLALNVNEGDIFEEDGSIKLVGQSQAQELFNEGVREETTDDMYSKLLKIKDSCKYITGVIDSILKEE